MPETYRTTTNPVRALKNALAFNGRDWGRTKVDAWLYGIILGWDDADDPELDAMGEMAKRHHWDAFDVANLRALHAHFESLPEDDA